MYPGFDINKVLDFQFMIDTTKTKSAKKLKALEKNHLRRSIYMNLMETALDSVDIDGLKDTSMNKRVLKEAFVFCDNFEIFRRMGDVFGLPAFPGVDFNIYGEPIASYVFGKNGFTAQVKNIMQGGDSDLITKGYSNITSSAIDTDLEGFFIRCSNTGYPIANFVYDYAVQMADTLQTIKMQRRHLKQPYLPMGPEEMANTAAEVAKKALDDDEEMIYLDTGVLPVDKFKIEQIPADANNIKSLTEVYDWYMSKFLTILGIDNNPNIGKKERMNTMEVGSNDEEINVSINPRIDYINEQLEEVNKTFGTNIRFVSAAQEYTPQEQEGEEEEIDEQDISDNID